MRIYFPSNIDHNAAGHICKGWDIRERRDPSEEYCYASIIVDDSSYRYRAIKGDQHLELYFASWEYVEFPAGSWCVFKQERYTLEKLANFKMIHRRNYEYSLTMEGAQSRLNRYRYRNKADGSLKFEMTAKPRQYLTELVHNLNSREGVGVWRAGESIESVEKHLSFNHTSCFDALKQMADAFSTEYEVVGNAGCTSACVKGCTTVHKAINLKKYEYKDAEPLEISYEYGIRPDNGIGRTNMNDSEPLDTLFVQGGDRNIDFSTYESEVLLLPPPDITDPLKPKSITVGFDGSEFYSKEEDIPKDVPTYVVSDDRLSITRKDRAPRNGEEGTLDASSIFPTWEHTVTETKSLPTADGKGFKWDIFAKNIEHNGDENTVDLSNNSPDNLDYGEYRLEGEKVSIIFQSGMLAGKEFELVQTEESLTGYVHAERRFKLESQDGMPGGNHVPRVGDTFKVFGTELPATYICDNDTQSGASWDMLKEAVRHLYENENQKYTIELEINGIWAKRDWLHRGANFKLGRYIRFFDFTWHPERVDIRITAIKDHINDPCYPEIELSNSIISSGLMSKVNKIVSNKDITDNQHKESIKFSKRRFKDATQTMGLLEKSLIDGFTESIKPITVNTMQLLVGSESLQFEFVQSKDTPTSVRHIVAYNKNTNELVARKGCVRHLTLDIDTVSPGHSDSEYKYWSMPEQTFVDLVDDVPYYLYIKASKVDETAMFHISETAKEMVGDDGYYYFTYGILNSRIEGDRSFTEMYGFTEITPGGIRTKKIVSLDGETYFDLEEGEIGGKIVFKSGSGGLTNVDGWNESQDAIKGVQNAVELANNAIVKLSDDNLISAIEKPQLKKEYDIIVAEYGLNTTQADSFNIDRSEYKAKYDALVSLVGGNLNNLSTDWEVNGEELRTAFKSYYTERTKILNAIAVATEKKIGDLQTDSNELLAKSMGYATYAEMMENVASGVTEINGGYINTNTLVVKQINTKPDKSTEQGLVQIDNSGARIGDISIDGDGSILVGTSSSGGVRLTKGSIVPLTSLFGSEEVKAPIYGNSWWVNQGSATSPKRLEGSFRVVNSNSTIRLTTQIKVSLAVANSQDYPDAKADFDVYLMNNNSTNRLKIVDYTWTAGSDNTYHINKDISGISAGDCGLGIVFRIGAGSPHLATVGTLDYAEVTCISNIHRTELGNNGYFTAWNSENYEHTAWSGTTSKLKKVFRGIAEFAGSFNVSAKAIFSGVAEFTGSLNVKAKAVFSGLAEFKGGTEVSGILKYNGYDVPEVLYSGSVDYDGNRGKFKACNGGMIYSYKISEGNYELSFRDSFRSADAYIVMLTGIDGVYASVYGQSETLFYVKTADDNTANNAGFNFLILNAIGNGWN